MITPLSAHWFLDARNPEGPGSHSSLLVQRTLLVTMYSFWPPALQTSELHMGSSDFFSGSLAMKSSRTTLASTPCYLYSFIICNEDRASHKSLCFNTCVDFWMTVPHLYRIFLLNWCFKIPAGSSWAVRYKNITSESYGHGSTQYLLHNKVVSLVRCYGVWDFMDNDAGWGPWVGHMNL